MEVLQLGDVDAEALDDRRGDPLGLRASVLGSLVSGLLTTAAVVAARVL